MIAVAILSEKQKDSPMKRTTILALTALILLACATFAVGAPGDSLQTQINDLQLQFKELNAANEIDRAMIKGSLEKIEARLETKIEKETDRTRDWVENATWYTDMIVGLASGLIGLIALIGLFLGWRVMMNSDEAKKEISEKLKEIRDLSAEYSTIHAEMKEERVVTVDELARKKAPKQPLTPRESNAVNKIATDQSATEFQRLQAQAIQAQVTENWRNALTLWKHCVQMQPSAIVHSNLAFCAHMLGRSDEKNKKALFELADEHYRLSTSITPDCQTLTNWAANYLDFSDLSYLEKDYEGAKAQLKEAANLSQKALTYNQEYHGAWNNLGSALIKEARLLSSRTEEDSKVKLIDRSIASFKKGLTVAPNDFNLLDNLSNTLSIHAQVLTISRIKKNELLHEAHDYALQARDSYPDNPNILTNLSVALINLATMAREDGHEDDFNSLIKEAHDYLTKAENITPGNGAYNLACIAALTDKKEECLTWLEKAYTLKKLPSCEEIQNENDFISLHDSEEFKKFLAKVCLQ